MPYHIKPGMVNKSIDLLERIDSAVREGKSMPYRCPPHRMSKVQYQLHNLLKATQVLTNEAGGRFATLRDRVRISMGRDAIYFHPKTSFNSILEESTVPTDPNEHDILDRLQDSPSKMDVAIFRPSPSFSVEQFRESLSKIGWRITLNQEGEETDYAENEDGTVVFAVQRKQQKEKKLSGFDLISKNYPDRE